MDFFYDGQVRRYVTQFMRIFIGFKYEAGDGTQTSVPVMYGDMTRQVANIIRENSENKLPNVPRIACYITNLELDASRLSDATFTSKMHIRERNYEFDSTGDPAYTGAQGAGYTVERLMPTPFKMRMKADIWTSNTDQKLQLLEQILVLFNPALEIQTTDNYIDWTSLSAVYLQNLQFSSRTIPAGTDTDIDIASVEFEMPVWLSPPAKVKKLGIIQTIIANIFTEEGNIKEIDQIIYNEADGEAQEIISPRVPVLIFKSNNGQPYDYDVTIIGDTDAGLDVDLEEVPAKTGKPHDWNVVIEKYGANTPSSKIYFMQPNGTEMVGTFAINPLDESVMVVTFDQDTIPTNTSIPSIYRSASSLTTIDAIIDPYKFDPINLWNGINNIPAGTRYLMLDDVNVSKNVGETGYDGPDAWKDANGDDTVIYANSIVEWTGTVWSEVFDPADPIATPTYIKNLRTGIQYKWDGVQWLKSFEGEYAAGSWRFDLNG